MRLALSALLLLACAQGAKLRMVPGASLAGYRRLAVLPGAGAGFRAALEKSLYEAGFDVVPPQAVDAMARELSLAPGEAPGPVTLRELGDRTKARGLVAWEFACRRSSLVILDPRGGEAVLQLSFTPSPCRAEEAARQAAAHLAREARLQERER